MSAEHIVWIVAGGLCLGGYGFAAYTVFAIRRRLRRQPTVHPHGHLPADFDYRELR